MFVTSLKKASYLWNVTIYKLFLKTAFSFDRDINILENNFYIWFNLNEYF